MNRAVFKQLTAVKLTSTGALNVYVKGEFANSVLSGRHSWRWGKQRIKKQSSSNVLRGNIAVTRYLNPADGTL
jgi:hypothetical protein